MLPLSPGCAAKYRAEWLSKIPFVYKRASEAFRDALPCPLYKQRREANEFLCGKGGFSLLRPLDRISVRAQHRLYTNKLVVPPPCGYDRRLPILQACS